VTELPVRSLRGLARALPIGLVLCLVAAGCVRGEQSLSSGAKSTKPVTTSSLPPCPLAALDQAVAAGKGPVKVELWHALAGKSKDEIDQLTKAFNASQHKVQIESRSQGNDYDEVLRKYQAGIPNRQLPAIAYIEDVNLRLMVDSGTVLPAESCMKADGSDPGLLPAVKNYYTADGVFWPGYVNVSEPVLYFNVNHFKKAGLDPNKPPKTLDEVEADAKALKKAGIAKPLALKLDPWFVECWINGAGALLVNKDNGRTGNPTAAEIQNPAALKVFQWISRMVKEGLALPVAKVAGNVDQYLAVASQKSSMLFETSTAATTIKAFLGGESISGAGGVDTGGATADLSALKPAAAPLPGLTQPGKVRVSGGAFYMTNTVSPAQQAGAWMFMRYMQEVKNQVSWHLLGSYLPTTQAAANDPSVTKFWTDDLAGRMLKVGYGELLTIDPARPGPTIGPYPEYDDALKNAMESMAFRGAAPEKALAGAQRDIGAALTTYAQDNATTGPSTSGPAPTTKPGG